MIICESFGLASGRMRAPLTDLGNSRITGRSRRRKKSQGLLGMVPISYPSRASSGLEVKSQLWSVYTLCMKSWDKERTSLK